MEKGGLPQIIQKTFDLYTQLLDTILYEQQRTNVYEHGFAGTLVLHHSEELLNVRRYAVTKRDMIQRAYIYYLPVRLCKARFQEPQDPVLPVGCPGGVLLKWRLQ